MGAAEILVKEEPRQNPPKESGTNDRDARITVAALIGSVSFNLLGFVLAPGDSAQPLYMLGIAGGHGTWVDWLTATYHILTTGSLDYFFVGTSLCITAFCGLVFFLNKRWILGTANYAVSGYLVHQVMGGEKPFQYMTMLYKWEWALASIGQVLTGVVVTLGIFLLLQSLFKGQSG